MNIVSMFETLIKEKKVEISDGVIITCGDEVNLAIFLEEGNPKIRFGSPAVNIHISKLGPLYLLNALRPTLESITLTPKAYLVSINNSPDIEIKRDDSNS